MKRLFIVYILLLFSILISISCDRRLVSRPIKSTYNQYGAADSLLIQFKSYQPIFSTDIIKITMSQPIHDSTLTIPFSLSTAHSLNIITSQISLPYINNNQYYLPISTNLTSQIWYQLRITLKIGLTLSYALFQLQIISQINTPYIQYSWNNGFEYCHLQQTNIPNLNTLFLKINNTLSYLSTTASQRYQVLLQINSTVSINQPVNITFQFYNFNASNLNITTNTTINSNINNGFIFVGSCYARCDYGDLYHSCIQSTQCLLSTTSITVTLPYMRANQVYLIQTYVINPPYISNVSIQAYWQDNSGNTKALTFANQMLVVNPVIVQAQQIRLLWDIPYNTVINQMDLGLIINDPLVQYQSLASFDIGFSVSDYTPIQGQYTVSIYVGANTVLQNTINHNLPSLKTTTKIICKYVKPNIICNNVDAFIIKNYRYYVRARGYFLTTDSLAAFGNVNIVALNQPNNLFINLVRGLAVKTIVNADYHDYGGLHQGISNWRIGETMVISHNDTLAPNSTSKSIQDFMYNTNSLVGVDTSVSPQQLVFFLKVGLNQMSLPNPTTFPQKYTMKVFTNPNIMNVSNLGIDFQAYSSVNQNWDVQNTACYVDSSTTPTIQRYSCQKYNDHVYNHQIDNTYVQTSKYGLYTSVCGNGQVVICPTTDCSARCQILKGGFNSTGMGTGSAGVLSIRNVTFIDSYQSPIEAGPNNFDFVIAFYQGNTLVSASIINAYTLNKTRLQSIRADLINYYHDNTLTNIGNRLPTLLKLSGHLTLQQAGRKRITSIRVHLPSLLTISNFIQTTTINTNNYGCSTNNCTASIGGLTKITDSWVTQNTIQISNLPSLTQQFTILFPVVYSTPSQLLQITVSFVQFDGKIGGVYRINGSSVSQILSGSINYIALPWVPVNPWLTTLTQWTNQPTLHTFKQSIDLNAIIPFATSNTINMGTTIMPTVNQTSPSTTFSSAYLNIFSNYSYPLVDGNIPCVNPFAYTYMNSYKVWTLWCPVQAGSLNQIKFNFPLYPDILGNNFPYSLIFAYAYANTTGRMIGYRVQQNLGGSPQTCITQKITSYNINLGTPQQNIFSISFSPFTLSPTFKSKFMLVLTIPTQIPFTINSCTAQQSSQYIPLSCSILTQSSNIFKLQILYTGTVQLQVYLLTITTKSIRSATSTITSIQQYSINMYLPFTDSGTLKPSFIGTVYSPFSSLFASCSNSFTYSSISSQQYIYLSKPILTAVSAGYYGTLSFIATFSSTRTTLFSTSQIQITFSQPILTPYSRCQFTPNTHIFSTSTIDSTNKILTLTPNKDIPYFTQTPYSISCSKIITNGNNITISMLWKDNTYNIQTTFSTIIASHLLINSITSTITTTIINKYYNTPGYLGQYYFTINLPTLINQNVKIYIDFGMNYIHQNFVQAYHLLVSNNTWNQILVFSTLTDVQSQIYLQLIGITASNIQLRIYGIHQMQIASALSNIKILVIKTNIVTRVSSYYLSSVIDTAGLSLTTSPIIIYGFNVDYTSTLRLNYSIPISYVGSFYVKFDQLFRIPPTFNFTCLLNTTAVPCLRTRPDLLLISTTISQTSSYITQLTVYNLSYFYSQIYDTEQVHFSMFIASSNLNTITYGSHQHLQNQLLTISLLPPQSLIWQIPNNIYKSVAQIVYVGYYGPPVKLILSTKKAYKQSFNYTYINSSIIYQVQDMYAWLGTTQDIVYIGTYNTSAYGYHNLIFNQYSSYVNIATLPIYVSSQKCTLTAEFPFYNIVSGGVTIPIAINMSACRPMATMTVATAINSPYMSVDPSLTTKTINITTQIIYIVVTHQLINGTVGQSYQLQVTLSSSNTIVQNAYNIIPNITIIVVDRSLLIGNPQAKQPIINYLTSKQVQFNIQCNTPATIYWGIGIYPTMLGITVQEIQARLVDKSNGLVSSSIDIYSWSHEQYGLSYVNDFNIQNNITAYGLEGGQDYVFKYYCVDQTGTSSGGKISQITTLASNYSLMKISLSFANKLNYQQINSLSCSISQQLIIPYNDTTSSVHSNCLNNTQIYYTNYMQYYDQITTYSSLINNKAYPYTYFFYIHTIQSTTLQITSKLANNFINNKIFTNKIVPYYNIIRSDPLHNNYQPVIYSINMNIQRNSFTISVDVGLVNTYLITAIMDRHFNPATMSLPTTYLMKLGYFSLIDQFDQIYSIYGSQRISATFSNLAEGQQLAVFYFVTVDNPALNSRSSSVYYYNLVTNLRPVVDLNDWKLGVILAGILAVFMGIGL